MLPTIEKLLQPGIHLMQQLRLKAKFALISMAFMLPMGVTLYAVVDYANVGIDFATSELEGSRYLQVMNQLMPEVLAARDHGRSVGASDLAALRQLPGGDDALKLKSDIEALSQSADAQQAMTKLLTLYANVGDNSNLILDPDLDSYYVMTVVVDYVPKMTDVAALLTRRMASVPAGGTPSAELVAEIRFLGSRLQTLTESTAQALQRASQANPTLSARLDHLQWQQAMRSLLSQTENFYDSSVVSTPAQLASSASSASTEALALAKVSGSILDDLLNHRIDGFKAKRNGYLCLTVGFLFLAAYLITAFFTCDSRGIEAVIFRMKKLASGDLTTNYPARGCDEIGTLINSFNDSRAELQTLVQRIHHAADTISTAGQEIAAANMNLAQRSSTQSSVIGETFERVKQISEKVQTNLESSGNANMIAEQAYSMAGRGKTVVDSVVTTMDAMTGSSKRIGAIIDVINEIAFQTNLLALNAAVEAARAGEQGRGFAVVAGEVRHLAQRCATAANEITGLIKTSVDDVNKGVGQVARAGTSMDEILESVRSVSDIMSEMAAAGKTQADGIRVVEHAVQKIDDDAQQNAALVEQTASAAELLRQQVGVLMESVTHFKLGSEEVPADVPIEHRQDHDADWSQSSAHAA